MKITIDDLDIFIKDSSKNIVQIAADNGIAIVAPCFRSKIRSSCCKACIIEVEGNIRYACGTKPIEGMNIIYNRSDLIESRDMAIKKYVESINATKSSSCSCGCDSSNPIKPISKEESCCGGSTDCNCN